MSYYMKLDLPKNPLIDYKAVSDTIVTGGYNLAVPKDVLNEEILDAFSDLKLKPKFVTLFGRQDKTSKEDNRLIHTDVGLTSNLTWKKMLFGINWEIGDAENLFSWWDMSQVKECWPNETILPYKYNLLNGIHYVERFKMGIPNGAVKLDETLIDRPTLVRTDVAHMTLYKSVSLNRVGVSVRFDESSFEAWEDVVAHLEHKKV